MKTFRELEHSGWEARAATYGSSIGRVTAQAIAPLLNSLGRLSGCQLLDVACGTGELAAQAVRRGADVTAIDFSQRMLDVAEASAPGAAFVLADAGTLPFGDACFDAVTCAFGLLHFAHADQAVAEARRVLRSGGRYGFCTWQPPDGGGGFFELVLGAIQRHGAQHIALPEAPPFFRFADAAQCHDLLTARGFAPPERRVVGLACRVEEPQQQLLLIQRGAVRVPMVLDAQTATARRAIEQAIVEGAAAYSGARGIELRMPVVITSAVAI